MDKTSRAPAILVALAAFFFLSSCVGTPRRATPSPAPLPAATGTVPASSPAPAQAADGEGVALFQSAMDALDNNHLSQAIKAFISVMAVAEESPFSKNLEASQKAIAELTKIGSRLSLEPGEAWLQADGTQMAGSTRSVGKDQGLQPTVYLYENFGGAKSPVADAPLAFEFSANSGSLNAFVTTDAYGKANTSVAKIQDPSKAAVIRAYPLFKAKGKAYAFTSIAREFTYLPPSNGVLVFSLDESPQGALGNSLTPDILAPYLKDSGLEALPKAGVADRDAFLAAYRGDRNAIARLAQDAKSGYLMLVYVEVFDVQQYEYKGKKYELYSAYARANARLIRADGTVLHSIALEKVKGDGGSSSKAVTAAYQASHEELAARLKAEARDIKEALSRD